MDLRKIKKLIELLEESGLQEMEIKEGEEAIRLTRPGSSFAGSAPAITSPMASSPPAEAARPESVEPPAAKEDQHAEAPAGHQVFSPMVGTYYSASDPDAAPFVTVGSKVAVGDTLCVIEAMKIFNQIESEKSGTVVRINKSDGEAVEYGELLFVIE